MAEILSLDEARQERTPHLSGAANCIACGHKWVAVCPVGTIWLDCPGCGKKRGTMSERVELDKPHWHCLCDNTLFHVTETEIYCPNCGRIQSFGGRTWPFAG